jgi:hypothetical protein
MGRGAISCRSGNTSKYYGDWNFDGREPFFPMEDFWTKSPIFCRDSRKPNQT